MPICSTCRNTFVQSTNSLPSGFCSRKCVIDYEKYALRTMIKRQDLAIKQARAVLGALLGEDTGIEPTMKNIELATMNLEQELGGCKNE